MRFSVLVATKRRAIRAGGIRTTSHATWHATSAWSGGPQPQTPHTECPQSPGQVAIESVPVSVSPHTINQAQVFASVGDIGSTTLIGCRNQKRISFPYLYPNPVAVHPALELTRFVVFELEAHYKKRLAKAFSDRPEPDDLVAELRKLAGKSRG